MSNKPDMSKYNPDPAYIKSLLAAADMSNTEAAATIGISARSMRGYTEAGTERPAPYTVQFALEAAASERCLECYTYVVGLKLGGVCSLCQSVTS